MFFTPIIWVIYEKETFCLGFLKSGTLGANSHPRYEDHTVPATTPSAIHFPLPSAILRLPLAILTLPLAIYAMLPKLTVEPRFHSLVVLDRLYVCLPGVFALWVDRSDFIMEFGREVR